ncbi:GIY-YIG nuclease family protein [Granulosicoccaceae sp. 1_MG-2023]|nr:GIY-YIG nuclease family protein [Granulosicoccaceae sp. 1_MG-2023]
MPLRPSNLPTDSGTYLLILCARRAQTVRVGKLGGFSVAPGFYYYVGSAFGGGGLRSRLSRHFKRDKTRRWHIDYLRHKTALAGAYWQCSADKAEDDWVIRLSQCNALSRPFSGFGASDSKQDSHLFFCPYLLSQTRLEQLTGVSLDGGLRAAALTYLKPHNSGQT